jgi:hypothetical protein
MLRKKGSRRGEKKKRKKKGHSYSPYYQTHFLI